MVLKYQPEIDSLKISKGCPESAVPISENFEAFRFCYSPITNSLNFLPNVVFDRLKGIPYDYESAPDSTKCLRCGASYYFNRDILRKKWGNLSKKNKENLGYTHIASGVLTKDDGLIKDIDGKGHFTLYEFETTDLSLKFNLSDTL